MDCTPITRRYEAFAFIMESISAWNQFVKGYRRTSFFVAALVRPLIVSGLSKYRATAVAAWKISKRWFKPLGICDRYGDPFRQAMEGKGLWKIERSIEREIIGTREVSGDKMIFRKNNAVCSVPGWSVLVAIEFISVPSFLVPSRWNTESIVKRIIIKIK